MGAIAFLDSIERPVRKRLIFWTFIGFLGIAFFLAWRDESRGRITAETDRNTFSNSLAILHGRFDGISDALLKANASNKVLTATINTQTTSNPVQSPQIHGNGNPINYGVQSFGQTGGITAETVVITNNAGAVFQASVIISTNAQEPPQNGIYTTTANIHLASPYPVGLLTIIALGDNLTNSPGLGAIRITQADTGVVQIRGGRWGAGYSLVEINNAYGNYKISIMSTNSNTIRIVWQVQ